MKLRDITLPNIRNYIEGTYNDLIKGFSNLEPHIQEQALIRMHLCEPCLKNTKCLRCGCGTPALFYAPSKKDSDSKWGPMLTKELWELHKLTQDEIPSFAGNTTSTATSYPAFTTISTTSINENNPNVGYNEGYLSTQSGSQVNISQANV